MDTPAIMHISRNCAPNHAQSDPRAAIVGLRARLATATARRTEAFNERTTVAGRHEFMFATAEQQTRMVKFVEERCSDAQENLAQAEANFATGIDDAKKWLRQTQTPEPPLSMPRSTNRVSYAKGSGYTASSSPVVPDPLAVQIHSLAHTDVLTGHISRSTTQHQGDERHSASFTFINSDGSMHLHVHTFNDSRPTQEPARKKPMHLFVNPEEPRTGLSSLVMTPVAESLARYMVRPEAEAEGKTGTRLGQDLALQRDAQRQARLNRWRY